VRYHCAEPISQPRSAARRRRGTAGCAQGEGDQGLRPGMTVDERDRIKALERRVGELRQATALCWAVRQSAQRRSNSQTCSNPTSLLNSEKE